MIARPIMKTDKGIYYSSLNSKLQRELVGDMEMMSHLGNSKYREPCTETKFKKKKEKEKDSVFEERLLQFVDLQTVKGKMVKKCWITFSNKIIHND